MKKNFLILVLLLFASYSFAAFVDINANILGVESSSTAWGDIDNDGDLDLVITGKTEASQFSANIYRNDGANVFTNINAGLTGVLEGSASWGDYNRDGYIDLIVAGQSGYGTSINTIYRNNGDYTFTDINAGIPGTMYSSTAWGDFDNDGDLDLLLSGATSLSVYRNNGNSTFTNINAPLTAITYGSAAWGDYDNDGDLDILATGVNVATYYTKLYKNNGNSTFTEVTTNMMNLGYGSIAWGDYDNDGDLDVLLTGNNGDYNFTKVYRNDGSNVFTDSGAGLANVGWGTAVWGDYDNDGKLDVLLSGHTGSTYIARIYHNNGGSFSDIGASLINNAYGSASWGDFNNDGKLDFIITGCSMTNTRIAKIYMNNYETVNNPPAAPANLRTYYDGSNVVFAWAPPWDDNTPPNGLTYQIRVGSTPGGNDIVTPMTATSGLLSIPQSGNANGTCTWKVPSSLLSSQVQYYWSVQAIDTGFKASPFAAEAEYKKLQLLSPNGGETWFGNTNYTIHWIANPTVSTVNVYASIDGVWIRQNTSPISAALGYYTFRIFNTASTTAQIRIMNAADDNDYDTSDSYFNITTTPGPLIELYQFSNNIVQAGKTYNFSWLTMYISNVKVEYTTNAGADWITIAASVPSNTNPFYWTVPNTPSAACLLRISDADNPNTYVWSNTPFTICSLELTAPNGGELLQTGSVKAITWKANQLGSVNLQYSTNGGTSWNSITSVSSALGTYNWTIPATASNQYKVRISSSTDNTIDDVSNAVFTAASLTLTYPTASGIKLQAGKVYTVTWSQEYLTGFIKLDYSTNGGSTYTAMTWGLMASAGSYNWTVPATTSANCKIRISSMDFPTFTNTSASAFTICSLALTSPNGSEVWGSQIVHNVTWSYAQIANLKVEYTSNNGATWNQIIEAIPATIGGVSWTTPNTQSSIYKVRITDTGYPTISDMSDNNFTVRPQIILSAPNGGESWSINTAKNIIWSATTDVANVNLDYSVNNGTDWLPIQVTVPASGGAYNWTIPDNASTQCLVKVSNAAMSSAFDTSDASFTIPVIPPTAAFTANITEGYEPMIVQFTDQSIAGSGTLTNWSWNFGDGATSALQNPAHNYAADGNYTVTLTVTNSHDSTSTITKTDYIHVLPSVLTILTPNGGNILNSNTNCAITWTATPNITHVNIDYSIDSGNSWTPIESIYPASGGVFHWTVPNTPSSNCLIRMSDANGGIPFDVSDSTFTIPVIPPTANFTADITGGYDYVTVQFTDQSVAGSGSLTNWHWNFGDEFTSTDQNPQHAFRPGTYTVTLTVTNSYDSTSTFVRTDYIHVLSSILTVDAPNGGEILNANTVYPITWTATPNIANVKLEYSINGGTEWLPIVETTPASAGVYQWTVPNSPSNNCLIMIGNTNDLALYDISNQPFTIPVIPPIANFATSTTEGYQPFGVQFTDNSIAGSGAITSWSWNFGDENTSDEQNPLHHYSYPGFYTVSLTVTNSYDSTATKTRTNYIHILPSVLNILTPNGGENVNVDSTYAITWTATPNINSIHIEYSIDGGHDWLELANNYPASSGTLNWTVPGTPSSNCLIRMIDANNPITLDQSDAPFTIHVILPTANFTSSATEGYQPFAVQFTDSSVPGSGTLTDWLWNFGDGETSTEQNPMHSYAVAGYYTVSLKVTNSYDSTATISRTDYIHVLPSVLTLLSPNGGDVMTCDTTYGITWTATPDISNVNLEYSFNGGTDWLPIVASCPGSAGFFNWMVPGTPSSNCLIRIIDSNHSTTFDLSDAPFTIRVILPTANFTSDVTEGYLPFFTVQFTDNSVPGSGTITNRLWDFGDGNTSTELNPVHIYGMTGYFNVSLAVTNSYDSTTVITKTDYIHILTSEINISSPTSGETLPIGSVYTINWTTTPDISTINIFYSKTSVPNWIPISMGIPATQGTYEWTVPNDPSTMCSILITNANYTNMNAVTNGYFTIPALAPIVNFICDINEGYAPKEIDFVDTSVPGSGTITNRLWNFGDGNTSTEQYAIHTYTEAGYYTVSLTVTNSYDSTATITRTDYIHILPYTLTLLTPNGGESVNMDSTYVISWTATPNVSLISIEYSINGGTDWTMIAGSFVASAGAFNWTVPETPSSNCLIRIVDAFNATKYDLSDSTFMIHGISPTVDFTADITEGLEPFTVQFTDQSAPGSGSLTNWLWNFGDGITSTEQNPSHIYTMEGYYEVMLTVTNSFNLTSTMTKTDYIHVLPYHPLILAQMSEPMTFGMVYYGFNSEAKHITLQNTGTAPLNITSCSFHLNNSPFSIEGVFLPAYLVPGNSITLNVRFTPIAVGSRADTLFIHNDSTNEPIIAIPLSGYSEYAPPKAPENLVLEKDEHNINLYWDPVTTDVMERPVEPDYYIVFYNDGSSPDGTFYYCGGSVDPFYIDMGVLWYAKTTLYRVRAFHTDGRRSLSKLPTLTRNMTEEEVVRLIKN